MANCSAAIGGVWRLSWQDRMKRLNSGDEEARHGEAGSTSADRGVWRRGWQAEELGDEVLIDLAKVLLSPWLLACTWLRS